MPLRDAADLAAWMAAAQSGDRESYARLLEAIEPIVFRFARRRLPTDDAARDVCQDVLMTVHKARHTYDASRPFEPWLYSIARARLIDHLRRERRVSYYEILTDSLPECPDACEPALPTELAVALEKLPAAQRDAFRMIQLDGLTTIEAARRAGVSVSALKVRAHRAYTSLRKALGVEASDE